MAERRTRIDPGKISTQQHGDDAAVLARVRDGEVQCFGVLVHRYKVRLIGYIQCRVSDVHVAEDLAQEVFLRVFRAAQSGAFAGRSGVKTWMFTIADNCVRDFWRARCITIRLAFLWKMQQLR